MKFSITYFYNIRFFKKNQVPISTAMWNPKWYEQKIDDRGILIGLSCNQFALPKADYESLHFNCNNCVNIGDQGKYDNCEFMRAYYRHLSSLDFNLLMHKFRLMEDYCKKMLRINDEIEFVLMVYETPDIKCAERPVLRRWFEENDIELPEWTKQNID